MNKKRLKIYLKKFGKVRNLIKNSVKKSATKVRNRRETRLTVNSLVIEQPNLQHVPSNGREF